MAYWWVSQNKTYQQERDGGYLWAPLEDKGGNRPHHWRTMEELRPGDTVFSYVGQRIQAVSTVLTAAHQSIQPTEFEQDDTWEPQGLRARLAYVDVPNVRIPDIIDQLKPLMPETLGPLNSLGTGNQGYLFPLPPKAGRFLSSAVGIDEGSLIADSLADNSIASQPTETERTVLAQSRIGQGQFRADLLDVWNQRCCVSGLTIERLLRASHIKPWRDSNNEERLDPFNGLLLGPQYDTAFDAGLVTFNHGGNIALSSRVQPSQFLLAGIAGTESINDLTAEHQYYLGYHRDEVFLG